MIIMSLSDLQIVVTLLGSVKHQYDIHKDNNSECSLICDRASSILILLTSLSIGSVFIRIIIIIIITNNIIIIIND